MKYSNFSTLATFTAIKPFLSKTVIASSVLDTAFEIGDSVYLARVVNEEFCDQSSEDAMNVTRFSNRDCDQAVYITPRNRSIFHGQLDDVVTLFKEGYKVYPLEEYEHGDTAIRLASNSCVRSAKAILTGSFREGVTLSCRFDSSYAFLAQPTDWTKPSKVFLEEFSNWLNGYSYSIEVLKATIGGTNDAGNSVFTIETLDQCTGYYSASSAESAALESLELICKHLQLVA